MAHVNRFSFELKGSLFSFAVLALAGCAGQSNLLSEGLRLTTQDTANDIIVIAEKPATNAVGLKPTLDDQVPVVIGKPVITPTSSAPDKQPAWCDYLKEDTLARTTILRSPQLNGSADDGGKSSVSLGLSLTDFGKANVMEESAEAQCRRYMAESGLKKLVFLSPQGLTSAGFRAKHDMIEKSKKDLQSLRKNIAQAMADGFLDREKATMLMGLVDQLLAESAAAKSQADRRTGDFLDSKDQASILGRAMVQAESDLEDLNSRMRTFDNVDVSISAGWSDDVTRDNFAMNSDAFSGKVSMSIKLGAVLPQRFDHEQRAKQAKLRAFGEEGGTLWQVNVLRLAHERAIAGLEESRLKIQSSMAESNKLLKALDGVKNPEFQGAAFNARIRVVQLKAEKAAVDGSIAEIRTNMQRLKTES
jgi:hypothetical protein